MNPTEIQIIVNAVVALFQAYLTTHSTPAQSPLLASHMALVKTLHPALVTPAPTPAPVAAPAPQTVETTETAK